LKGLGGICVLKNRFLLFLAYTFILQFFFLQSYSVPILHSLSDFYRAWESKPTPEAYVMIHSFISFFAFTSVQNNIIVHFLQIHSLLFPHGYSKNFVFFLITPSKPYFWRGCPRRSALNIQLKSVKFLKKKEKSGQEEGHSRRTWRTLQSSAPTFPRHNIKMALFIVLFLFLFLIYKSIFIFPNFFSEFGGHIEIIMQLLMDSRGKMNRAVA